MRVLGIDPSLTSTGLAVIESHHNVAACLTGYSKSTGRRADAIAAIDRRIQHIADVVMNWLPADLAVIEGPSIGSFGGSPWDRAGLWWRIVHRLLAAEVPVAVCPPKTRAKWATNNGSASKAQVAVAVSRLWPQCPAEVDDEWDALAFATIGAQHLGLPVPTRAHHTAQLAKVAWPETLEVPA